MFTFFVLYWGSFIAMTIFVGLPPDFSLSLDGLSDIQWWLDYTVAWPAYFIALQVVLFVFWPRFRAYMIGRVLLTVIFLSITLFLLYLRVQFLF